MEESKRNFHHPYKPYDIQDAMMEEIYECIANGQIGIFESPTDNGEPDWIMDQAQAQEKMALVEKKLELEDRLRKIRFNELRQSLKNEHGERPAKKLQTQNAKDSLDSIDEARFELDEYHSEDDVNPKAKTQAAFDGGGGLSTASLDLMEKLGMAHSNAKEDDLSLIDETKVLYCSRTHSQLTQFVHEMHRVNLRPASWFSEAKRSTNTSDLNQICIKHLPLGSRKNLCINQKVAKLGNVTAINERCLELQQQGFAEEEKCSFFPTKESQPLVTSFRDHVLSAVHDIEDLGPLGYKLGICPYYATRAAIKPSEACILIITLPYPLLLQKSARQAVNISLKGHVVIIDEAHNLMDAISNVHSVAITQTQLKQCRSLLKIYLQRFRNRLKGKNRVYVTQLVRLLDSLSASLENFTRNSKTSDGVMTVGDLLSEKGVDQINLHKLMHYLRGSHLARKVDAYANYIETQETNPNVKPRLSSSPILSLVQAFLLTLTYPSSEGRFFYETTMNNDYAIKYVLLDPAYQFSEIMENARAVILVGGTMSPMEDYVRHLFAEIDPTRLRTWSCGHIIPKENLIVSLIDKASSGVAFDFVYGKRNSANLINGLGESLFQLAEVIPDGLVVFFPSYSYMDQVISQWQQHQIGSARTTWELLESKKPIFRELKGTNNSEDVLKNYSEAINQRQGGLLLSVVGGKLSEGINFSDKLGRGVVVVGLPFPNIQSPQWKAKLEYIEQRVITRGGSIAESKAVGREFYENACMRAVNQSIGRAIRHQKDFASIILLDQRYKTPRIANKLPSWIKQGIVHQQHEEKFENSVNSLQKFFDARISN